MLQRYACDSWTYPHACSHGHACKILVFWHTGTPKLNVSCWQLVASDIMSSSVVAELAESSVTHPRRGEHRHRVWMDPE